MNQQHEPIEEILNKLRERRENGLLNALCAVATESQHIQEDTSQEEIEKILSSVFDE